MIAAMIAVLFVPMWTITGAIIELVRSRIHVKTRPARNVPTTARATAIVAPGRPEKFAPTGLVCIASSTGRTCHSPKRSEDQIAAFSGE